MRWWEGGNNKDSCFAYNHLKYRLVGRWERYSDRSPRIVFELIYQLFIAQFRAAPLSLLRFDPARPVRSCMNGWMDDWTKQQLTRSTTTHSNNRPSVRRPFIAKENTILINSEINYFISAENPPPDTCLGIWYSERRIKHFILVLSMTNSVLRQGNRANYVFCHRADRQKIARVVDGMRRRLLGEDKNTAWWSRTR